MIKEIYVFMIAMLIVATPSIASVTVDVGGVSFSKSLDTEDQRLHLHGAGLLKYMVFIDAYAGALYLPETVQANYVLKPVPKKLVLEYFHNIKGEDFANATRKKIADNVTEAQVNVLQSRIDDLAALYRDVKPGDRYALTYVLLLVLEPIVGQPCCLCVNCCRIILSAVSHLVVGVWNILSLPFEPLSVFAHC